MILFHQRRNNLLHILHRSPGALSTMDIHDRLRDSFHSSSHDIKTTLRDLETLALTEVVKSLGKGAGPDKRARYWALGRRSFDLTLLPTEAMTLSAIFDHAERFGLKAQTEMLHGLRDFSALVMQEASTRSLDWARRITTGTRFTVLQPGKYDPAHLARIQEAILDNEPLEVTYLPRDAGGVECVYQLKPLALSHQDSNTYLSAYVLEEQWPAGHAPEPGAKRGKYSSNGPGTMCALMLHRVVKVEPGKRLIPDPEGYDVNSLEAQKHLMTIHSPVPVQIKLRLSANLHNRLSENPLCEDQVLVEDDRGWVLSCNLYDTQGLRLFLLSNAADIEVLAPLELRTHVRDTLQQAMKHYERDQPSHL